MPRSKGQKYQRVDNIELLRELSFLTGGAAGRLFLVGGGQNFYVTWPYENCNTVL